MPILDKIEFELNSKINGWINIRYTINRYLQAVEHHMTGNERKDTKVN